MNGLAPGPAEIRTVAVLSHTQPEQTAEAVRLAIELASAAGCELVASETERSKHAGAAAGIGALEDLGARPDACLVLGGDGTILKALRHFADTDVPVFGINFGTVGFLAAVEGDDVRAGLEHAFKGEFEVLSLPALDAGEGRTAFNDVSFHRRPHGRVAELTFSLGGQDVGHVRCDGLVAATPAGSTGYNLANNGPILAWGVEGYVVSFIAPHTLTARPLVAAPDDVLILRNAAGREAVDLVIDGEHVADLESGGAIEIRFRDDAARLAQLPGGNFYRRIGDKFGRLARAES